LNNIINKHKIHLILIIFLAAILRFYRLDSVPPSLYWDEASLGYNAYSIATSLKDEHGEFLPLARFIAFGDYKPPGYIYAAAIAVRLFGLNELAVRLPSVLAGIAIVYLVYLTILEIAKEKKKALLAALFTAFSPWALHLSRGAFEANLAAAFNLAGIYFFAKARKTGYFYLPSVIFFCLSFYTFNANRIIAPLMLLSLSLIYLKELLKNRSWYALAVAAGLIMLLPSTGFLKARESRLRMEEVSIFTNPQPVESSNERIALAGSGPAARLIHNRRWLFAADYLKHYFDNFSGKFLFTHGDANPRIHIQGMGELYYFDLAPVVIGLYLAAKYLRGYNLLFLAWLFIVPLPAAVARETPHALRIVSAMPVFHWLSASGLLFIIQELRKKTADFFIPLAAAVALLFILNTALYLHNYHLHFATKWSGEWQYGYKEMVKYVLERQNEYDNIFVTQSLGRPYIYFAFYQPFETEEFLMKKTAVRDWFGFYNVTALGKIKFDLEKSTSSPGKTLLVVPDGDLPAGFNMLKTINNLSGRPAFIIAEKL